MKSVQFSAARTATVPTLIGETPARFAVGGRIRAGVKGLTTNAAREPKAQALYDAGVAAGKSFDDIEAEITRAVPELQHPLVPKNVPYFTVRGADFAMPEVADLILEKFGEERGDGVTRLYRFPVVFPADAWQAIMPHALMCYGASQLKYWSEYSPDGRERHCMTFDRVPVDGNGKRAIRIFGGRKHIRRAENHGRCDPEICPEYQSKQCNLSGRFIFLIPGIPSIHAIELATNSFYSMNAARQTLETVGFLRSGRISGFLDGRTSFWLTKRLHDVPMIGEDGQPRRVPQWLIELEAPVDLTRLLRIEGDETRLVDGERAAAVLNGVVTATKGAVTDTEPIAPMTPPAMKADDSQDGVTSSDALQLDRASSLTQNPAAAEAVGERALDRLFALIADLDVPREKFERYARKKYGAGWSRNANGIRRVLGTVEAMKDNSHGLLAAIDAELDVVV